MRGKTALKLLFKANKRLHTAYLLKESFGQLWDYDTPGWARRVFEQGRGAVVGGPAAGAPRGSPKGGRTTGGNLACLPTNKKKSPGFFSRPQKKKTGGSTHGRG